MSFAVEQRRSLAVGRSGSDSCGFRLFFFVRMDDIASYHCASLYFDEFGKTII
uniref:Uncharacterized protein n=1 Tax=Heterorhabditis bacteriophora TaxID=37862 RepID=A0A1I7WLM2_HETBA